MAISTRGTANQVALGANASLKPEKFDTKQADDLYNWSSLRSSTSSAPGTCGTEWMRVLPHAPGIGCFWLWRNRFPKH